MNRDYKDLTLKELKKIRVMSKDFKISLKELHPIIASVSDEFALSKTDALEVMKMVKDGIVYI